MASGALAAMAYIVFEGSLVGIFSYFASDALDQWFGWTVNWLVLAVVCIAVIAVLGYFDISRRRDGPRRVPRRRGGAARRAGGLGARQGRSRTASRSARSTRSRRSPPARGRRVRRRRRSGAPLAAGSAAIGLFFAFWSWVGFETTAVYGEESRNPRSGSCRRRRCSPWSGSASSTRSCPWMVIAGNGAAGHRRQGRERLDRAVHRPRRGQPRRALDRRRLPGADRLRLVRLRAGLPQRRVALHVRDRPRDPGAAPLARRDPPDARLAAPGLRRADRHHRWS